MFGMGMGELLLILVVALLVVGPDKLPQAAKAIGKGIRDFRRHSQELQSTIEQDEKLGEAVRELRSALRDDPLRPLRAPFRPAPPPPAPGPTPAADPSPSIAPPPIDDAAPPLAPPAIVPAAGAVAKNAARPEASTAAAETPRTPDDPAHG